MIYLKMMEYYLAKYVGCKKIKNKTPKKYNFVSRLLRKCMGNFVAKIVNIWSDSITV